MGFLVSPGVQVKEIDLTNVVPAVATSIGAVAGPFAKGPVGEITTIGSASIAIHLQYCTQGCIFHGHTSTWRLLQPASR